MPQLADNLQVTKDTIAGGPIASNGSYNAYVSSDINTANNKAIDAVIKVHSFTPDRSQLGKAKMMLLLERKDDGGNWHPIHTLYQSVNAIEYDATTNGGIIPDQQISYGPQVFNLDGAVAIDASDGINIVAQDHQKRGVLPDTIRLRVVLHELDYGTTRQFDQITFSLDYELRPE